MLQLLRPGSNMDGRVVGHGGRIAETSTVGRASELSRVISRHDTTWLREVTKKAIVHASRSPPRPSPAHSDCGSESKRCLLWTGSGAVGPANVKGRSCAEISERQGRLVRKPHWPGVGLSFSTTTTHSENKNDNHQGSWESSSLKEAWPSWELGSAVSSLPRDPSPALRLSRLVSSRNRKPTG